MNNENYDIYWCGWTKWRKFSTHFKKVIQYNLGEYARWKWGVYKKENNIKLKKCVQCCNDKTTICGHHPDYSLPLLILPLCTNCHIPYHTDNPSKLIEPVQVMELLTINEFLEFMSVPHQRERQKHEITKDLLEYNNSDYLDFKIIKSI